MGTRTVSSFGELQEAYSELAVAQAVTSSIEVGLGGTLHLRASHELRLVRGDAGDFSTQAVFAGVGVRR
jgi:hypothetical protein